MLKLTYLMGCIEENVIWNTDVRQITNRGLLGLSKRLSQELPQVESVGKSHVNSWNFICDVFSREN